MKKLFLFLIFGVSAFFATSCGGELILTSLEGSSWQEKSGPHSTYTLTFTATHAIAVSSDKDGTTKREVGKYTYDYPNVVIYELAQNDMGEPHMYSHKGTIKGKTLSIDVHETDDQVVMLELKLQ